MDHIIINYKGKFFIINKEPFESQEDVYKRGWFIIKNINNYENYNELISVSLMNNYKNKKMAWE